MSEVLRTENDFVEVVRIVAEVVGRSDKVISLLYGPAEHAVIVAQCT